MILYEITIEVRNLCVRILFRSPPTLGRICECTSIIFADHAHVEKGMIELLLSIGDDNRQDIVFDIGDRVNFTEDDESIGYMELQSRTLFDG